MFYFWFRFHVDYRHAKEEEEEERRRWRNGGIFNNMKNIDTIYLGFFYFGNSLRSIKTGYESFSQTKEAFKMVFGVCSIGVFSHFCWILIMNHYRGL